MKKIIETFCLSTLTVLVFASSASAEGTWTSYANSNHINSVAYDITYIWCGTYNGGLVRWNEDSETYKVFSTPDGLKNNCVKDVIADNEGVIWILYQTDLYQPEKYYGVTSFDGNEFRTCKTEDGLAGNAVYSVVVDSNNVKWIGTDGGLSSFDGNSFVNYTDHYDLQYGVNSYKGLKLDDEGNLLVLTRQFLLRYDGQTWIDIVYNYGGFGFFTLAPDGTIWFSRYYDWGIFELYSFDGTELNFHNLTDDTGQGLDIHCPIFDENGIGWFSFMHNLGGMEVITEIASINEGTVTVYTDENDVPPYALNDYVFDKYGIKWIASGDGLVRFDGNNYATLTIPGPGRNWIPDLTFDNSGNLWCATRGGGISCFDGTNWTTFTTDDGLTNNGALSVAIDNNNVKWFGTRGGLSSFDGNEWHQYYEANGQELEYIRGLAVDNTGIVWCGGSNGVASFDGEEWTLYDNEIIESINTIYVIAVDNYNIKWFCGQNGLVMFDGINWQKYSTDNCDIIGNYIRDIYFDKNGFVWVAVGYQGISRFNREETWTNYTVDNSGLPTDDIQSIAVDNNNILWIGTREIGVVCYDGADWKIFNTDDGLIDNFVISIAIAEDNTKWFGTYYCGISSFDDKIDSVDNPKDIPSVIDIQRNYPNPFNPSTTIEFSIPKESYITLSVYDITGQKVTTLIDKWMNAGSHSVLFDGSDLGSGVYLYKLESEGFSKKGKMLLMK